MTARLVAGMLAVASLTLAGCGGSRGPGLVSYTGGGHVEEKKVGEDGLYTLHAGNQPHITYRVAKGERVGFRKASGGSIEAYAGDNPPIELDRDSAKGAYWDVEGKAGKGNHKH